MTNDPPADPSGPDDDGTAVSQPAPEAPADAAQASAGASSGIRTDRPTPTLLGGGDERAYNLELPQFEGPLDLLLHLVRRHELDILDIPISFVCEKYLEYLAFMQALDLEVAGDYLVMAATLAYLKSRELVPPDPTEEVEEEFSDEDGPDPRAELIARLLEYQKFRRAASDLDQLPVSGRDVFDRGGAVDLPPLDPGLSPITLYRLAEAYHRILDRARIHKSHEVVMERVTVAARMEQLVLILDSRPRFEFESLFLDREWSSEAELRSMLVVTLMSILELTKLGIVHVHQPHESPTIMIERKATPDEARRALSGYDEYVSFGEGVASTKPDSDESGSDSGNHD